MGQSVDVSTYVARLKSYFSKTLDGLGQPITAPGGIRRGPYGDLSVMALAAASEHPLADEGSWFVATNPTPGTGVAYALQTSFSDTANGLFVIQNNQPAGGANLWLKYIKLILTGTAPASTTSMDFTIRTDTSAMTPTAGSVQIAGGAGAQTIFETNHPDATAPQVNIWAFSAGAMTVPATSASGRRVGRIHIPTNVAVSGDEYEVQFGAPDRNSGSAGLTAARATAPARMVAHAAPVVLQPQSWAVVTMWWNGAATNTPNFEYELGLVVR